MENYDFKSRSTLNIYFKFFSCCHSKALNFLKIKDLKSNILPSKRNLNALLHVPACNARQTGRRVKERGFFKLNVIS